MKEEIKKILSISDKTYYNWKKEKRPIIGFLEKYFTKEELEDYLKYNKIIKLDNIDLLNQEGLSLYSKFVMSLGSNALNLFFELLKEITSIEKSLNDEKNGEIIIKNNRSIEDEYILFILNKDDEKYKNEDKVMLISALNKINNITLFFYIAKYLCKTKFKEFYGDVSKLSFKDFTNDDFNFPYRVKKAYYFNNHIKTYIEHFTNIKYPDKNTITLASVNIDHPNYDIIEEFKYDIQDHSYFRKLYKLVFPNEDISFKTKESEIESNLWI